MYGHSRAELIYIPLVSGQKRDGNIIQSHSKFKIIADTYQMATLSLFEDYSVDSFTKSFLANKLKVDYNKLDNLVLSHLEKLKIIKIQAWIHHIQGSPGNSRSHPIFGTEKCMEEVNITCWTSHQFEMSF